MKNGPAKTAYMREYNQRPEVKERHNARGRANYGPEQKAKRQANYEKFMSDPANRAARAAKGKILRATPEYKKYALEYERRYHANPVNLAKVRARQAQPKARSATSEARYMKKYGLDYSDWARMYEHQNRTCPICKSRLSLDSRQTHVDHCHKSGKVRGLLCVSCNVLLGKLEARAFDVSAFAAYTLSPPAAKFAAGRSTNVDLISPGVAGL